MTAAAAAAAAAAAEPALKALPPDAPLPAASRSLIAAPAGTTARPPSPAAAATAVAPVAAAWPTAGSVTCQRAVAPPAAGDPEPTSAREAEAAPRPEDPGPAFPPMRLGDRAADEATSAGQGTAAAPLLRVPCAGVDTVATCSRGRAVLGGAPVTCTRDCAGAGLDEPIASFATISRADAGGGVATLERKSAAAESTASDFGALPTTTDNAEVDVPGFAVPETLSIVERLTGVSEECKSFSSCCNLLCQPLIAWLSTLPGNEAATKCQRR